MKRIISVLLLIALCTLAFVSCGPEEVETRVGYFTSGDNGYFFTPAGVLKVTANGATATTYTYENGTYTVDGTAIADADLVAASFTAPAESDSFTYTERSGKKYISGLTDAGKAQAILFAPANCAGIEEGALAEGTAKVFIIGSMTSFNVGNGAFKGTNGLSVYIDGANTTTAITCGKDMLKDTTGVTLYVGAAAYGNFKDDYTWGVFSSNIKKYQ